MLTTVDTRSRLTDKSFRRSANTVDITREQWRYLLKLGIVGAVVLVSAISMHAQRFWGWPLLILFLVVGLIGGAGAIFLWDRLKPVWSRFPTKHRVLLVGAVVALIMAVSLASNYGRPDATANILVDLAGIIFALLLWGFYWLFCRFLDAIWARLHNR
jgi:hypothetical protein